MPGRIRLLETAFDHGIRHFDTAPLYGMGLAEEVVGCFARGRRADITITTKFGLVPPALSPWQRPLVPVARVLRRHLRGRFESGLHKLVSRRVSRPPSHPSPSSSSSGARFSQQASPQSTEPKTCKPYNTEALRASVEASLQKLRTDYIDNLLLHECQPGQINEEVIELLEQLIDAGKIRRYGLGSGRASSRVILERWQAFHGVVQIPDHFLQTDTAWFAEHSVSPLFTHSVLQTLSRDPAYAATLEALLKRWAERINQDPAKPGLLAELLLVGGLLSNSKGCVLFSTARSERIIAHARTLSQLASLGAPLRELVAEPSAKRS